MPSLAAGLAAERRRKNAKHARRLEKKLGVKVAGSEERRLSDLKRNADFFNLAIAKWNDRTFADEVLGMACYTYVLKTIEIP